MNVPQVGGGVDAGMLALSNARMMQNRAVPQRFTNQFGFTQFGNPFAQFEYRPQQVLPNSGRANIPTNPVNLPDSLRGAAKNPLLSTSQTASKDEYNVIKYFQEAETPPPVIGLFTAMQMFSGNQDEIRSTLEANGYQLTMDEREREVFVLTEQTQNPSLDGTQPVGNAPAAGYTWSGGAWHAPAGQDPYSDVRSVYYSRSRGYVTPDVANRLRRQRRRGNEIRRQRAAQKAITPEPSGNTQEVTGLVNFKVSFG